jgi:hypothetical protein
MNKQQTAVEWLEELYYKSAGNLYGDDFEKALAMEKEQIFDAWDSALINTHIASNSIGVPYDKEKYYNETYNKSNV